jgi:hypothetical protein
MRVQFFVAADYANITGEGKLNVMGIFRSIKAINFPARHASMVIVLSLVAEFGEDEMTRNLVVKLLDADGEEQFAVKGQANFPRYRGPGTPEVNAILELKDIVFQTPGDYIFVVLVDSDNKAELSVQVNQVQPDSMDIDQ